MLLLEKMYVQKRLGSLLIRSQSNKANGNNESTSKLYIYVYTTSLFFSIKIRSLKTSVDYVQTRQIVELVKVEQIE